MITDSLATTIPSRAIRSRLNSLRRSVFRDYFGDHLTVYRASRLSCIHDNFSDYSAMQQNRKDGRRSIHHYSNIMSRRAKRAHWYGEEAQMLCGA